MPFGMDQPVLIDAVLDHAEQRFRVAGFEQEAEHAAFVHGGDGRFEIGLAGEHHAHGLRGDLVDLGEETRAVHVRHAHVGDHHGERTLRADDVEPRGTAGGGFDFHAIAQLAADAVEHVRLVVDEQHAVFHDGAHAGAPCAMASAHIWRHSFHLAARLCFSRYSKFRNSSGERGSPICG